MVIAHNEMKQRLMETGLLDTDTLNVIYVGKKINGFSLGLQDYCQLSS
jgi:Fe2+ transport system protein FeoA